MPEQVTIIVNLSTIESNNSELLMCEAKDYLENTEKLKKAV